MAIRFKLGGYETVTDDPLGRGYVGYFPRMTESEAWEAGRGIWKANRDKITRQRFALVVGEGIVRAIAEITGHTEHETATGTRVALTGTLLPDGHPVREAYLGKPDPIATGSQNPVGYAELEQEKPYLLRPCACGCGDQSDRDFLPGHDVRAIQARVRDQFAGSALALIQFLDQHAAASTPKNSPADRRAALLRYLYDHPGHRPTDGISIPDYLGIEDIAEIVEPAVRTAWEQRWVHVIEDAKETVAELERQQLITTTGLWGVDRGPLARLTAQGRAAVEENA